MTKNPILRFVKTWRHFVAGKVTDQLAPGVADVLVSRRRVAEYVVEEKRKRK